MFNLARTERALIAVLILTLLLGIGISAYKKANPSINVRVESRSFEVGQDVGELPSFRVNINDADEADLATLKGVGKVLAGRIVEYRNSHGPFSSIEGIKNVKGVGPALYERIKGSISTE